MIFGLNFILTKVLIAMNHLLIKIRCKLFCEDINLYLINYGYTININVIDGCGLYGWDLCKAYFNLKAWAYVEDLLPKGCKK